MIDFACADFTFPVLSHKNALSLIALMGFNKVDIGLFKDRSHIQPDDQFDFPEKRGAALKKLTGDLGLQVCDIFLQSSLDFKEFAINHPSARIRAGQREMFERAMEYVAAAGSDHFTGLPGTNFDGDSRRICIEELEWRVAYAKSLGIIYCVEPHFGSIMEQPEATVAILKEVEGLTLALDHSHYTSQGYEIERLRPLADYASHMHARGAAPGEMQTSVKRNKTDFARVVEHIMAAGFSGSICMEYCYIDWENCNRTDNVSETLLLREYLRGLLNIT